MNNYINISKINRQKIPSDQIKTFGFEENNHSIPRNTKFSGHFRLKYPKLFTSIEII